MKISDTPPSSLEGTISLYLVGQMLEDHAVDEVFPYW